MSAAHSEAAMMTAEEATAWLREVGGELYRTPPSYGDGRAWVAVVRTPDANAKRGKLIVALGESAQEATAAASEQWHHLWMKQSVLH